MNEDYPDLVSSVIAPELQCIAIYCNILQSCPLREAPKRQEICLQSSRSYDQLCEIQFLAGIVNIKNEAGEALVTGSQHVRERSSDPCYQGLYSHCFPTNSLKFTCPAVFSSWSGQNHGWTLEGYQRPFFVKIWSVVSLLIAPTTREKLGIGTVPWNIPGKKVTLAHCLLIDDLD